MFLSQIIEHMKIKQYYRLRATIIILQSLGISRTYYSCAIILYCNLHPQWHYDGLCKPSFSGILYVHFDDLHQPHPCAGINGINGCDGVNGVPQPLCKWCKWCEWCKWRYFTNHTSPILVQNCVNGLNDDPPPTKPPRSYSVNGYINCVNGIPPLHPPQPTSQSQSCKWFKYYKWC